jgi:hypothetical protein
MLFSCFSATLLPWLTPEPLTLFCREMQLADSQAITQIVSGKTPETIFIIGYNSDTCISRPKCGGFGDKGLIIGRLLVDVR